MQFPIRSYMQYKISLKLITAIVIAATYSSLVIVLQFISFGPIQIRVADMLSPITYVTGFEGVLGLTLGTLIGNFVSPYGILDMVIGTLCTFVFSSINWLLGRVFGYRKWLLPVVALVDALVVGIFIGVILLGVVYNAGEPIYLFALLTGENLVATMPGALLLVPLIRKYYQRLVK
ncbi:MAG: QueT transporter family protein [Ignisphaera sp.]